VPTPSRAPTHKQLRSFAMFGGLMMGLGLLSLMRPGSVRVRPVERVPAADIERSAEVTPPRERVHRAKPSEGSTSARPDPVEPEPVGSDEPVEISFRVVDGDGRAIRAALEPLDCPGIQFSSVQTFRVPPGRCVVRAVRQDGLLTARGEPIVLQVRPGVDRSFDITMDAPPQGGIGVQFRVDQGGMRVVRVIGGSPAARAGLEAGDLIVAIEGEPLEGVDVEGLVERMTGPEGSDVEFTIELSTDTGTSQQRVLVPRERLGA